MTPQESNELHRLINTIVHYEYKFRTSRDDDGSMEKMCDISRRKVDDFVDSMLQASRNTTLPAPVLPEHERLNKTLVSADLTMLGDFVRRFEIAEKKLAKLELEVQAGKNKT